MTMARAVHGRSKMLAGIRPSRGLRAARASGCNLLAAFALTAVCAAATGACSDGGPGIGAEGLAVSVPGPWVIPDDVRAAGATQNVPFTGAGPWVGEDGCGGGLLEGTGLLRDYVYAYFPQAWQIGGYACRPIVGDPNNMSVHATGRALDIMVYPVGYPDGSEADNEMGDPLGNWLIVNAERIGIQQIIWDRWLWRAEDSPQDRAYTGEHPHNDHLHVELSVDAAALGTPFFQSEQGPPMLPSCGVVPAEGVVIDDIDRCADFYGPPQYWRSVDGEGEGGELLWTDTFEGAEPSNWARWSLDMAAAGRYRIEYHAVAAYAVAPRVRYEVRHGAETTPVWVDQGAAAGWVSLGEFDFAAGPYQSVALFDNVDAPTGEDQHAVFDALRVTPCGEDSCDDAPPGEPDGDGDGEEGELGGGCRASGSAPGAPAALALFMVLILLRRRTRRRGLE